MLLGWGDRINMMRKKIKRNELCNLIYLFISLKKLYIITFESKHERVGDGLMLRTQDRRIAVWL